MKNRILPLLMMLALIPLSHATDMGWMGVAGIAVITSAAMLGIVYMIGFGFSIHELTTLSKDEAYQLAAVIALIGGLTLIQTGGDAILGAFGDGAGIQQSAMTQTSTMTGTLSSIFGSLGDIERRVSLEGSKSLTCSILAVGYTISGCGGYTLISPAIATVEATVGLAIAELSAIGKLMEIGFNNSFTILLPIGIIFRTFKITRGAGGLIIAVAIAFYFVLPLAMISMWKISDTFKDPAYTGTLPGILISSCDAAQTDDLSGEDLDNMLFGDLPSTDTNPGKAINVLAQLRGVIPFYLFPALIYGIITPAIALLIMVASIRVIAGIAGADVDVSVLSRVI